MNNEPKPIFYGTPLEEECADRLYDEFYALQQAKNDTPMEIDTPELIARREDCAVWRTLNSLGFSIGDDRTYGDGLLRAVQWAKSAAALSAQADVAEAEKLSYQFEKFLQDLDNSSS